jgi:hypothetical protein
VDILDAIFLGLPDPVGPDSKRPLAHNVAALIATLAFPVALFFLVLLTSLHRQPELSMFAMPVLLAAVSCGICRAVDADWSWTLRVVLVCAFSSFMFAGIAFLLAAFAAFYSTF